MAASTGSRRLCVEEGLSPAFECVGRTIGQSGLFMLALMVALALVAPSRGQKTTVYVQGHSVQIGSENNFEPTVAMLSSGERLCPSVRTEVLARSCPSKLLSAPTSANAILANCKREAAKLGCKDTAGDQLVSVRAIYDITVSGQYPDQCMIAKISLGSQNDRYVDIRSLDFRADPKPGEGCYSIPPVRVRISKPQVERLLAGIDSEHGVAGGSQLTASRRPG